MACTWHPIISRDRPVEVDPAGFDHFELGPGEAIDGAVLARDPTWTLYAIDPDRDRALLLQLPADVDLAQQPFAYVAQFDRAVAAAVLSTDELVTLGHDLPKPAKLVHLFSTGRCGSTLASRIFAELDGVWSVSEPDAIAQLASRRDQYGTPRTRTLLGAASAWSYRPAVPDPSETCVLKYRSEAIFDAEDYVLATPDSTSLFLYRDLEGWVGSTYRFAQKHGADVSLGSADMRDKIWPVVSAAASPDLVADICDPLDPDTPIEISLSALWTLRIEAYEAVVATGVEMHAVSYRALNHDREATVRLLLRVLGHDRPDNLATAMRAYESDSQVGTAGARDRDAVPLGDQGRARIAELVRTNERVARAVAVADGWDVSV